MSSIAGQVGGSKTTLWAYFPSKEDLFAAVVDDVVEQYGHLAALFYGRGPRRGKARLAAYLEAAMARGEVRAGDLLACAHQLIGLCQAERYQHVILNLSGLPDRHQITADAEAAVDIFLHAWARRDD